MSTEKQNLAQLHRDLGSKSQHRQMARQATNV